VTPTKARLLHVSNGHSATGTIEKAGIPGRTSVWCDVLYEGPVPPDVSDDELIEIRARFIGDDDSPGAPRVADVARDMREWRAVIANHGAYDELVLWFEHDLFDQLALIQLLTFTRSAAVPKDKVKLICIGTFPGRPDFKGLGELRPEELAPLLDTRVPVTDAQYALAGRAWTAFRSSDPRAIDDFLRTDTSALPFLAPALRRYLEERPSERDGLSRSERRLLEIAREGPIEIWSAFPRMHHGETAYYITDGSFGSLLDRLAAASPPLISLDVPTREPGRLPRGTVSITDEGRRLLTDRG